MKNAAKVSIEKVTFSQIFYPMANAEHLEILRSGVEKWNKWRKRNLWIKPDLRNVELTSDNLAYANFSSADMAYATIFASDLNNANLQSADLSFAKFIETNMIYADFAGVVMGYTNFSLCNLKDCKGLESVTVMESCAIDFQTLRASKNIPKSFLLKIGLPELFIEYLRELS